MLLVRPMRVTDKLNLYGERMNGITSTVLGEEELHNIGQFLQAVDSITEQTITTLRQIHPQLRFTLCSDDDIGEREAYCCYSTFELHLVASQRGGCSYLTHDINLSTGIVVALLQE